VKVKLDSAIKLSAVPLKLMQNKLMSLNLKHCLMFGGKARSLPYYAPLSAYSRIFRNVENFVFLKRFSLFCLAGRCVEEKFYKIDTCGLCYKNMMIVNDNCRE
jgi:hypothetical protein